MEKYNFDQEKEFDPIKHVEKKLGLFGEGDVSIACWEPGQVSPNHCHPEATEIYFCFEGGGIMRTLDEQIDVVKEGLWFTRVESYMNLQMDLSGRYYSEYVMVIL